MTRQTSVQLTEATERQVEALKEAGYGGFTDIVRVAIDRMYRDEADTLNIVNATHTYVVEYPDDETGMPFLVTFADKSGTSVLGPYVNEAFADREAAIAHAQALVGMALDWETLTIFAQHNDSRIVWASDEEERQ